MADEFAWPFECERCGLSAQVFVEPAYPESDNELTLEVAACPACARRQPHRVLRSALRMLGYSGMGCAFVAGCGSIAGGIALGGLSVILGTTFEIRKWRAGGRLRIARQLRAPRQLPLPPAYVRR